MEFKSERLIVGKVIVFRIECPYCDGASLSAEPFVCPDCGNDFNQEKIADRIVTRGNTNRKNPKFLGKQDWLAMIAGQDEKCYWCAREFGIPFREKTKLRFLKPTRDHVIPYSFGGEIADSKENIVAACQICNNYKSGRMFDSREECRAFILKKWSKAMAKYRFGFYVDHGSSSIDKASIPKEASDDKTPEV